MRIKRAVIILLILGYSVGVFLLGKASKRGHVPKQITSTASINAPTEKLVHPESPNKKPGGGPQPISTQPKSVAMVPEDRKLSHGIAKEVDLTETEILKLQAILDTHWERMSRIVAKHVLADPLRNDPANGIHAFRIPTFPEGEAERDSLREALDLGFGDKAEPIFGSLRTYARFGNFGSDEVLIQFHNMNDENDASIHYTAQNYDPTSGKRLSGTSGQLWYLKHVYGDSFKVE